jgi:hypothetical protein
MSRRTAHGILWLQNRVIHVTCNCNKALALVLARCFLCPPARPPKAAAEAASLPPELSPIAASLGMLICLIPGRSYSTFPRSIPRPCTCACSCSQAICSSSLQADVFPSLALLPALSSLDLSSNPWVNSSHIDLLMNLWELSRMAHLGAAAAHAAPQQAQHVGPQQAQQAQHGGAQQAGPQGYLQPLQYHPAMLPAPAPPPQQAQQAPPDRWPALRRLSFRGCEQLGGLGPLFLRHPGLTHVDISGTAACDADVELLGTLWAGTVCASLTRGYACLCACMWML